MLLILLAACLQELSGTCETHRDCDDGAICAKGVCLGEPCQQTDDCAGGWECTDALGSSTCLLACGEDADCLGQTACVSMPESSDPESLAADYCL